MFEGLAKPAPKTPEALHSEHLKEGVKPIMAVVCRYEDIFTGEGEVVDGKNVEMDPESREAIRRIKEFGESVMYAGPYVFSNTNEKDKFSEQDEGGESDKFSEVYAEMYRPGYYWHKQGDRSADFFHDA